MSDDNYFRPVQFFSSSSGRNCDAGSASPPKALFLHLGAHQAADSVGGWIRGGRIRGGERHHHEAGNAQGRQL